MTVAFVAAWAAACVAAVLGAPTLIDRAVNRIHSRDPDPSRRGVVHAEPAVAGAPGVLIADLHADSLLWPRRLLDHGTHGHVDVPRLIEAGVGLQVFGLVTRVPLIPDLHSNDGETDAIALLAPASRWPRATWTSPLERALFLAGRLDALVSSSGGRVYPVLSRADLQTLIARRAAGERVVGAVLAVEGAHAIEGRLQNVDRLFEAGVRMMSPSHFFDTRVGGSAHGARKHGLTRLGREVIARMETIGMAVDLAHASPATIHEVAAMSTRPLVASHTGVRGTCDHIRNLDDEAVDAIAHSGGVIGIGYWETAICGRDIASIVRAIRYVADRVGHRHVALGSDFDGAVTVPFDTTGVPQLHAALLADGFSREQAADIMGRNALRVLHETLPPGR